MSGIFGILHLDGSEILSPDVDAMARQLERRGPDGTHCWQDGNVALGHTLLATTPEALVEVLPLTDPDSGCTITADVRLDNRDELIPQLGLDGADRVIGDGELILKAYLRWGEDCPNKLLGDFAFVIWDPGRKHLFCARDHMGMRQLIYHYQPGKLFVFATEVEAVIAHSGVPQVINEGRIADYLDNLEGLDLTSTFFEGVRRLPPAHASFAGAEGFEPQRYWTFKAPAPLRLPSDADYDAAFLDLFRRAVACRLRTRGPIGVLLSGGIDSNAVAFTAAEILEDQDRPRLLTFSGVGPDAANCVETASILAAVEQGEFTATLVDHARQGPELDDLAASVAQCAEPFDAPMSLHRALYARARQAGVKVMLDGVGGDLVANAGNVVGELVRSGRFRAAAREARGQFGAMPIGAAARQMLATAWSLVVPKPVRRWRRLILQKMESRGLLAGKTDIAADFARTTRLRDRRKIFDDREARAPTFGLNYRIACLFHPHLVVGRERYDRIASAFGIEHRDPFLDLRVIEFCMSLPLDQLHRDGVGKLILRRALARLVPPEVRNRRAKEHLGWDFTQAVMARLDPPLLAKTNLVNIVSNDALQRLDRSSPKAVDRLRWFEIVSLAFWLARVNGHHSQLSVRECSDVDYGTE